MFSEMFGLGLFFFISLSCVIQVNELEGKLNKNDTPFSCLSSSGRASVRLAVCRVQQNPAGLFSVGAEECRCSSPGALGLGFVRVANQSPSGSAASQRLLL